MFYVGSLLMIRSQNVDNTIIANPGNVFGNTAAYRATFPNGIAGAYRDYMTNTILPQINTPPKYLTELWTNVFGPNLYAAYNLPNVQVQYLNDWMEFYNLAAEINAKYFVNGRFSWEYTFAFTWDVTNVKKRDFAELARRQGSCPFPSNTETLCIPL